jgi:3',5'-cyclic-AMP phosphodiesterase
VSTRARPVDPELMSVGPDEVVVTFTTEGPQAVVTRVGDREDVTDGPYHVARVTGLAPDTEYPLAVEGAAPDRWLPESVRTLVLPPGRLLATVATANDVHFGETECGRTGDPATDAIGPVLSVAAGEEPYPLVMGRAAVAEMAAIDPDAVVVKGDLTDTGRAEEYAQFLEVYGAFGDRLHHVRGNHDAMRDVTLATCGTPYVVELTGVTLAVLDSTAPGHVGGALGAEQLTWLDDVAAGAGSPVMVFAHHPPWDFDARHPVDPHYAIARDDSERLVDVIARRHRIVGFFAGHTHTNRVVRRERSRNVPLVEVACAKDYPGAWAEYRCYEGGYTQVMRRISAPDALAWSERCRHMIQGIYRDLVLGSIRSRCFTYRY